MTFEALIGPAHHSPTNQNIWTALNYSDVVNVASSWWYEADPAQDPPVTTNYGWSHKLTNSEDGGNHHYRLLIPFIYRWTADFTGQPCAIFEILGPTALDSCRRLTLNTNERVQIFDVNNDSVGSGAIHSAGNDYGGLWYFDHVTDDITRDIFWWFNGTTWDKEIDVINHGNSSIIDGGAGWVTMGTRGGKTSPTTGGPILVRDGAVINLLQAPNRIPYGSITVAAAAPTGDSAVDGDYDTGVPDFNDIDDIPSNETNKDVGDAAGEKTAYSLPSIASGKIPLAVQIYGSQKKIGTAGAMTTRGYLLNGGVRDYLPTSAPITTQSRGVAGTIGDGPVYNLLNGVPWTEADFNSMEVGHELVTRVSADTIELYQLGVEYALEGSRPLPGDFPMHHRFVPHNQPGLLKREVVGY